MGSALLGLLAGALTTLSPCVLPILPVVLLAAANQHRYGPLALVGGLVSAFTAFGVFVSGAAFALDLPADALRRASAVLLALFGLILMSGALRERLAVLGAGVSNAANGFFGRFAPNGLAGQFAVGALLGVVWVPCSGPTLGAALTLAAQSHGVAKAALVMIAFGIGACVPLVGLAYGSREALKTRRAALAAFARAANPLLGVALAAIGILIFAGLDRSLQAVLVNRMPDWLLQLTTRY
jgi:cytochrome c-type biogenesis protein